MSASAFADIEASVDRNRVELNESFTLTLSIDSNTNATPDTSALEADFFVGPGRDMSNTSIINGQIQRSRSWSWPLMAKRAGELQIPSITIGSESSEALTISVVEPTYQPPGEADVFITTEVDTAETYVQAQVLYRIKVYRAVATRQPTLKDPSFEGAEVLIEAVGDGSDYDAILGGKAYTVNERIYALFPQESGEIRISPARFEARVLRDGRITGRKVFTSESQTINVKPIPAPPAEFAGAAWLPAQDVTLSENWSDSLDELVAGEPVTRSVTVAALGQLETQIPVIEPPESDAVNVYADKPELSRSNESTGIRGIREDQYALIGVEAGTVTLPDLELPWFDLTTEEWQVARLPGREIVIVPGDDAFAPPPEETVDEAAVAEGPVTVVESPFWRMLSQFLGAAWALTLLAWWWSSRPTRDEKTPEPPPIYKQQSTALKRGRNAAKADDAAGVKAAILEWARLEWPDDAPRSIGDVAARVHEPLAGELNKLSRSSYGAGESSWDSDALAKAMRSVRVIKDDDRGDGGELLPPLMPG